MKSLRIVFAYRCTLGMNLWLELAIDLLMEWVAVPINIDSDCRIK